MNPPASTAPTAGADHASTPAAAPGYTPYPRLSSEDMAPPPPPPYHAATATPSAYGSNPYVASPAGASAAAPKSTMDSEKDMLGKMGKRVGEAARKTDTITRNFLLHLKTGSSITDAAIGRVSQITKVTLLKVDMRRFSIRLLMSPLVKNSRRHMLVIYQPRLVLLWVCFTCPM